MFKLPQRLSFDLTNTFTGNRKLLTNLFEGMISVHANPKTHTQNTFFTRGERCQNARGGFTQVGLNRCIKRLNGVFIFDEIAKMAVFLVPDRGFERDRLFGNFQNLANLSSGIRSFSPVSGSVHDRFHATSGAKYAQAC